MKIENISTLIEIRQLFTLNQFYCISSRPFYSYVEKYKKKKRSYRTIALKEEKYVRKS